jgi:hypothetical protein
MKKLVTAVAAIMSLSLAPLYAAEHDHAGHGKDSHGKAAHQEVVDGVKATFNIKTMQAAMKEMGMEMPQGVKETHHLSISFIDIQSGKAITTGEVMVKIQAPDKSEQTKELPAMHGHFGADFNLAKKGKYGVMCRFKLPDGKVRSAKFWHEIK